MQMQQDSLLTTHNNIIEDTAKTSRFVDEKFNIGEQVDIETLKAESAQALDVLEEKDPKKSAPKNPFLKTKNLGPRWICCYGDEDGYFKVLKIQNLVSRPDLWKWDRVPYKTYFDEKYTFQGGLKYSASCVTFDEFGYKVLLCGGALKTNGMATNETWLIP